MFKLAIVGMTVLSVSACSQLWKENGITGNNTPVAPAQEARTANEIELYQGGTAGQPFTVIENIKVAVNKTTAFNADPTVSQVEERLKKSAVELGGDAVINVAISDVKVRVMTWGGRTDTGKVVKY